MILRQTDRNININSYSIISFKAEQEQSKYSQLRKDLENLALVTEQDIIQVKDSQPKESFIKKIKTFYKHAKKGYRAILISSIALFSFACGYFIKPIFIGNERNKFEELKKMRQDMLDECRNDSIRLDSINTQLANKQRKLDSVNKVLFEKRAEMDDGSTEPVSICIHPNRHFSFYPNGKLKKEIAVDDKGLILYEAEYAPDGHKIREYSELGDINMKTPPKYIVEYFDDESLKYKRIERFWQSGKSRYVAYEIKYRSPGIKEMELKTHRDKKNRVVQEICTYDESGEYYNLSTKIL